MNFKKEISLRAPGVNRGFFIALEGLDGAGKTTQSRLLCESLRALGLDPKEVKEPTSGPWGQKIRTLARAGRQGVLPEEELEYFVRDRAEDVAENIGPALLAGRPVVADRYILSSVAYQSALGLEEGRILKANQSFPWPDLIVILETPVATGLERIASSRPEGPDRAFERPEYLRRVKAAFDRQNLPGLMRLNGQDDPETIRDHILDELRARGFIREALEIIDSHCHLSEPDFQADLPGVLDRARMAGVKAIFDVGLGPANARQVLELADKIPIIHPVLGWHPHEADDFSPASLKELLALAQDPRVKGFGEIGLDFCLMHSSRENQLRAFESLLEAATDLDMPVVVHSREAFVETYDLLKKYAPRLKRGVLIHGFTRGWDEARAWVELGFHLSLPGVLTFPKATEMKESAALIPADRLLVETDAPYLTPAPFRGRRNEPAHLVYHLQALAEIRGLSLAEAAALTTANARRFYHLP
jgi:thymidylate kinase